MHGTISYMQDDACVHVIARAENRSCGNEMPVLRME